MVEVERKIILQGVQGHLMVLEKHTLDVNLELLSRARNELLMYTTNAETGTWGYFPELKDENTYHSSQALSDYLQFLLGKGLDWKLAFVRLATKEPRSEYGGFHIDVDLGIGHTKPAEFQGKEIVRALVNVGAVPRTLAYIDKTRDELAKEGYAINPNKYEILKFSQDMIKTIDIPPISEQNIWVLKFCSSQLPHFGLTDSRGHFLAAYGAWTS